MWLIVFAPILLSEYILVSYSKHDVFQDVGTSHLCDGICEQEGAGLSTLVLWNNQLTYQSMSAVGRALVSVLSYLATRILFHSNCLLL